MAGVINATGNNGFGLCACTACTVYLRLRHNSARQTHTHTRDGVESDVYRERGRSSHGRFDVSCLYGTDYNIIINTFLHIPRPAAISLALCSKNYQRRTR